MDPPKEFSRVELSLDNCIIHKDRLLETCSAKDGMSHDLEVDLRIMGCDLIQSAGLLLRLPQVAMAAAQVLLQRFYYSKSLVKYSMQPMAMACIFLAAKIEEDCRRLRDIINVFHLLKQKRTKSHSGHQRVMAQWRLTLFCLSVLWLAGDVCNCQVKGEEEQHKYLLPGLLEPTVPMEYMGEEYFKTKNTVIKYERFLLKELGFCVHVKHPHKLIITYLQILGLENTPLGQRSWNFMNDGLRTNLFVRYPPETIACACIFLAARQLQIPLPQSPPWWILFDTSYEEIEVISMELLALYKRPMRSLEDLEKEVSKLKEELMSKKQVEIKEICLKQESSNTASPLISSPVAASMTEDKGKSAASRSPLLPCPPPISKVLNGGGGGPPGPKKPDNPPLAVQHSLPIRNGESVSLQKKLKVFASLSGQGMPPSLLKGRTSCPAKPSPGAVAASDHSSGGTPPPPGPGSSSSKLASGYKPIQSPIKLSSSDEDMQLNYFSSPSPPASQENGLPKHYSREYDNDREYRRSRHRHRYEKQEEEIVRSRSIEEEYSRSHKHHRHHHRSREEKRSHHSKHKLPHSSSGGAVEREHHRLKKSDSRSKYTYR